MNVRPCFIKVNYATLPWLMSKISFPIVMRKPFRWVFSNLSVLSQENLCFTDRLGLPCKRFHELIEDSSMPEWENCRKNLRTKILLNWSQKQIYLIISHQVTMNIILLQTVLFLIMWSYINWNKFFKMTSKTVLTCYDYS